MRETRLTVYFEDPFWVGVFERIEDGTLSVCKLTFGAEPKEQEIWELILRDFQRLRFSTAQAIEQRRRADSPKRRQREAKRQLEASGVGTKAQQALARQREEQKTERRQLSRQQKEAEQQRRFEEKQRKRREKHRGH